jgi:hypothetical protein
MRLSEGLGGDLLHSRDHEPTSRQPSNCHESKGVEVVQNNKVTEDWQVGQPDVQSPQDTYPEHRVDNPPRAPELAERQVLGDESYHRLRQPQRPDQRLQ